MALSALQYRILSVIAEIDRRGRLALAGGGAMNVHGFVERPTKDLDLFTDDPDDLAELVAEIAEGLEDRHMSVERSTVRGGFGRLIVDGAVVEFAYDPRWLDPVRTDVGLALDGRELAANKLCALFGRQEPRDLIDVAQLARHYPMEEMVAWARATDSGFSLAVTIEMVMATRPTSEVLRDLGLTAELFEELRAAVIESLAAIGPGDVADR